MTVTKKRVIVLGAICIVLLAVLIFFLITKGTVRTVDGVKQNSRIYMENVAYEDGSIFFSVINKTPRRVTCAKNPYMQRYENGAWIYVPGTVDRSEMAFFVDAFDSAKAQFAVQPEAMLPGEYRLISGEAKPLDGGEDGARAELELCGDLYIVGYFTVS